MSQRAPGVLIVADHRILIHRLKDSLPGEHPLQPDEVKAIKAWLKARGTDSPILFTSVRNEPISRRGLEHGFDFHQSRSQPDRHRIFYCLQ
jgi:integrase